MINKVKITLLLSALSLQACSLFPYEDKFGCNRGDNLGKCVSAIEAYEEITTGKSSAPYMKPYSEQNHDNEEQAFDSVETVKTSPSIVTPTSRGLSGYDKYLDANYTEVASLLDSPITPIIKPVKTAELLIIPYSNSAKVLKGERYINVILEDPSFILGDYLKKQPIQMKSLFNEL
jgi:conjugal transfer pilus assembly protein TraV